MEEPFFSLSPSLPEYMSRKEKNEAQKLRATGRARHRIIVAQEKGMRWMGEEIWSRIRMVFTRVSVMTAAC